MPSLYRYEEGTCDNCGTQTTKLNLARHKQRCSAGTLLWSQCPNFSTKLQNDLNYHIISRTAPQNLISPSSLNFVMQNFQAFMLYVHTKTLNMDHKVDSERTILMWRI